MSAQRRVWWMVVMVVAALTGCGQSQPVPVPSTDSSTPAPAAAATDAESDVDLQDAAAVVEAMAAAGVATKLIKVYTEADDPNELLGRPGGYIAKSAFADTRIRAADVEGADMDGIERGGSVEIYPSNAGAVQRGQFIQTVTQAMGGIAGREYDYVAGPVLVRVTGKLTPIEAKEYQAALTRIVGEDAVLVEAAVLPSPS